MAQEQAREYDITETFVVLYTINGLVQNPEPTLTISEKLWKILDPTSSLCVMGATEVTERLYQLGSEKYGIDVKLRDWILPPDRIAVALVTLKNGLRSVAYFTPKFLRGFLPIDLLCNDVAMFASRAGSVLKVTKKTQACVTLAGEIAKDTLVKESAKEADKMLQRSMKSAVRMVVPLSETVIKAPVSPQQPAPVIAIAPVAQRSPALPAVLKADVAEKSWGSSLWGVVKSAATSEMGQSLLKTAAATVVTQAPVLKSTQAPAASAPLSWTDTVKLVVQNEQVRKASLSAVKAYQTGDTSALVSAASDYAMSQLPSREDVVDFAVAKASATLTKPVVDAANEKIDHCVEEMNERLAEKEKEYLTQVSTVVVDNAAKQVLTFCMSSGLCIATAAWVVPSVTKWGLSFFMGDAAVETLATTVKYAAIALTGVAVVQTTGTYRAQREANQKKFSPLKSVEAQVKAKAMEAVTHQAAQWLPGSEGEQSIVGQFTKRCQEELPTAFASTGNSPRK